MAATTSSSSKRKGNEPSNNNKKKAKVAVGKEQSSSQKKRAVKHERQSHRKHADAVATSKEIWNKLRLKNNSPEEKRRLVAELMDLLRGKVNEVALQHDASRVVQAAIQFGTAEERKEIIMELCQTGSLAELSKIQYAHFVILKMIKYCSRDEDCVRAIVKVRYSYYRESGLCASSELLSPRAFPGVKGKHSKACRACCGCKNCRTLVLDLFPKNHSPLEARILWAALFAFCH